MTILTENLRLFCCIANSLEDGCLPRIGTANDEDTKTALVSVAFLCPLLLGIQHWKETFVAEMPEMVEVVKNQDKHSGQCIVWLCWSVTGVTSLAHFRQCLP